jgi:hypothetical protein
MNLEPSPDPLQATASTASTSHSPIDSDVALSENGNCTKKVRFSDAKLPNPAIIDNYIASSPIINSVSRKTKARRSLPAPLPRPTTSYIEEVQFTPLVDVLDNRTQRRIRRNRLNEETNSDQNKRADARKDDQIETLRQEVAEKDKTCKDFEMELEERRFLGIEINDEHQGKDSRLKSMEEDLATLRTKLAAYEQAEDNSTLTFSPDHNNLNATDMEDDGDMEIVELTDIGLTQQDVVPDSALGEVTYQPLPSPVEFVLDPVFEQEVCRFEEVVKTLTKQAADAKAALQIVEIELRNLGFTKGSSSPEEILGAIRTAFRQARQELGELLPATDDGLGMDDATNGGFLPYLIQHIRGLVAGFLTERENVGRKEEELALLRGQHKGLLDKLSEMQDRNTRLQNLTQKMDEAMEQRIKDNALLTEGWDSSVDVIKLQEDEIAKLNECVLEMKEKIAEQIVTYDDLGLGFRRAARELEDASLIAASLQEQYNVALEKLRQENADVKRAFEMETSNERLAKERAQNDCNAQQTLIVGLEQRAQELMDLVSGLREQLILAQSYGPTESATRDTVRGILSHKDAVIRGLEGRIIGLDLRLSTEQHMLEAVAVSYAERYDEHEAFKLKTADDYSALQTSSKNEMEELQAQIEHLEWSLSNSEDRCMETEEQVGKETRECEDRFTALDEQIEELRGEVEYLKEENAELERAKLSLEQRVSHEAYQMLEFQNQATANVVKLNANIAAQEPRYRQLQQDSAERETALRKELASRDDQVHELGKIVSEIHGRLSSGDSERLT